MVEDRIKELAHQKTYEHFFCNVGDNDWPDDPDAFIDKTEFRSEEDECKAVELSYEDEYGKCMDIWEPFERYSVDSIVELMDNYEAGLIAFYREAKKMEEEE